MTSPIPPNSPSGQQSVPCFTDEKIESQGETAIWPQLGRASSIRLSDEWWTVRHGDRLHSPQDEGVQDGGHSLTSPSPHASPNSPVYKAVSPLEAATVDEVDTLLEVLFAREESKKALSAGVGGTGLQEAVPIPPISEMARDKEP